jgi:hypothetical protein
VVALESKPIPLSPILEATEYQDLTFIQRLQSHSSLVDDDPQLTQMYWYGLGHHQSEVEALLNCHW